MDARYPRIARLRRPADFRRVVQRGAVHPGAEAVVRRVGNDVGTARLGIATPRRYGNAVRRNRFRRLVREAFRACRGELGSYDYFVAPRKGIATPTLAGLRSDLLRTLTARPAPPRKARR